MRMFEAFYADGRVLHGTTRDDWAALPDGLQAVIFLHDDGDAREKVYGFDEYTLDDSGVIFGDDRELPGPAKKGALVSDAEYRAVIGALEINSQIWHTDFSTQQDTKT